VSVDSLIINEGATAREEIGRAPRAVDDDGVSVKRVSVCIPARDEERTIVRLLDALVHQTRQPDEIVVADGGSTDETREIVRRFAAAASVPVVLVEDAHALPGRGRNLAIARAGSDWVA
jgi:glycosyltransferase involved in cell wall biosynthesis